MITLCTIPDVNRFFHVIDSCSGTVTASLPQSSDYDLKNDASIRSFMKSLNGGYRGSLSLKFSDEKDARSILHYMMG
jgi:hypothetical protein